MPSLFISSTMPRPASDRPASVPGRRHRPADLVGAIVSQREEAHAFERKRRRSLSDRTLQEVPALDTENRRRFARPLRAASMSGGARAGWTRPFPARFLRFSISADNW